MKWKKRHGLVKSSRRLIKPFRIVLHHTGGSTASGAISALYSRGLGYHYLVDKKGDVHELVPPNRRTWHAKGANTGTVGISFVSGGKAGPVNKKQIQSCIQLMKIIKGDYPSLREVTGHKHVDKRGKSDPQWPGEPVGKNRWKIDKRYMRDIAKKTGYEFISKFDLRGESNWTKLKKYSVL